MSSVTSVVLRGRLRVEIDARIRSLETLREEQDHLRSSRHGLMMLGFTNTFGDRRRAEVDQAITYQRAKLKECFVALEAIDLGIDGIRTQYAEDKIDVEQMEALIERLLRAQMDNA